MRWFLGADEQERGRVYAQEVVGRWAREVNEKQLRACDSPLSALEARKMGVNGAHGAVRTLRLPYKRGQVKDRRSPGSSLHGMGTTSEGAVRGYMHGQWIPTLAHPSQTLSPAGCLHPPAGPALQRIRD